MKKINFLLLSIGILSCAACTRLTDDAWISTATQSAEQGRYVLLTPAYYRNAPEGGAIEVRFYESQAIYAISESDPQFSAYKQLLDATIQGAKPVHVYLTSEREPIVSIAALEKATEQEIQVVQQARSEIPEPQNVKKIIPSMEVLNEIFTFCQQQNCALGTATIDYCIPFQYVVDGCYARAHKMRQIMIDQFGYSCEKVFSYEGPSGYLAVDAGDCCVYWWYHVAPLVTVQMPHGIKKFVVDPSMFDEPVSIETWTSAQENLDCSPYADFGYTDITPGQIYAPGGSMDNFYSSTNWTLQVYADLVTCP
ncbi:MAG: protein-glutamine glutaminase family protein [Chitinophagales bacterium]